MSTASLRRASSNTGSPASVLRGQRTGAFLEEAIEGAWRSRSMVEAIWLGGAADRRGAGQTLEVRHCARAMPVSEVFASG